MGNNMDLKKNCKKKGNTDPEPGQIKYIKKRPTHQLEEEKIDNDMIPE